ncbi:MAG TPA: hypothetical protein PK054_03805 [Anaerohalosphaeraceae bacterium]|nr:hypothetical protein [Anaerohalosphaeraceae bacterium]HOL88803.1 hypothetical protein [Anaerohalosphaeraceae bacterium]HPP55687.1 hypothetical protein [Anaerohalosphaeraceae bacterium]
MVEKDIQGKGRAMAVQFILGRAGTGKTRLAIVYYFVYYKI